MSTASAQAQSPSHVRPLTVRDLERVIAIDAATTGRNRLGFYSRRLEAALAEPKHYVYTGWDDGGGLQGFMFARITDGEFGASTPVAVIDALGVDPAGQHRGVGQAMLAATQAVLAHRGVGTMETQAEWRNHRLLQFFDRSGFELAPRYVLEREVTAPTAADPAEEAGFAERTELDYGAPPEADYSTLAHDRVPCRSLRAQDLDAIVRIDRRVTGVDRRRYFERKLREVLAFSGIRVSLVAELDGHVVGVVMARVDFGEFARADPLAVLDTLGVDPGYAHKRVATALMSQLMANLAVLRIERVRTQIDADAHALHGFFRRSGFAPSQELAFRRRVG